MRILSVTTIPLRDDAASWRILNLAKLLKMKGFDVKIIQYLWGSKHKKIQKTNIKFDVPISEIPVYTFTVHLRHLIEICKNRCDLVYGNTHMGTFCSLLGKIKCPLIFDQHGGLVEEFLLRNGTPKLLTPSFFKFLVFKFIDYTDMYFADRILCVSHKMIEYLCDYKNIDADKLVYVPNGVDLEFFKPNNSDRVNILRKELGLENKLVFGYIGGFQKWQGVENFIRAAQMINDPEVSFIIVGGEKIVKKENLQIIPRVSRNYIVDYYSICDILVLPRPKHPATEIAAPTKFAEYTAVGKPVLTTNVGDATDFVRKYKCGIVVKDNSPRSLVEGILKFKELSERKLQMMGRNSRRLAEEEFDWGKIGDTLSKIVEEVV